MKLTPENRKRILKVAQGILAIFERVSIYLDKYFQKKIERKKREFYLQYKEEMMNEEIKEYRNRLTLGWLVIFVFVLFILYIIGGRLF